MSAPSKSQVNKAGRVLRRWARGELTDPSAQRAALDVLLAFRAAHEVPLTKANMGLRSVVRTERCRVEVSQRLKRVPTIIDKLTREPTMQLANMQDIGGCRSVLDSIDEVRRVQKRLAKNRPPLRVTDYIDAPRVSGYRGVHVIAAYDDRPIEVQLRTRVMHEWAITVERLSGRLAEDLKSGRGPNPCSTGWKPSPKQWRWRNRVPRWTLLSSAASHNSERWLYPSSEEACHDRAHPALPARVRSRAGEADRDPGVRRGL